MSHEDPLENNEEISDRLLELATQLDRKQSRDGQEVFSPSTDDASVDQLSEHEQVALQRVRHAVDFMRALTPDEFDVGKETQRNAKDNTPTERLPNSRVVEPKTDRLGRFQIKREIGEGGFARVYLAHDPRLNRDIALKLLRGTLFFSSDATKRFEREAQAAAILSHPNIVPVYEAGVIDDQRFIASAYCDGITLDQWLSKTKVVVPKQAAAMVAQMADALEHAHQRGVIHRDLKPANVLLEPISAGYVDPQGLDCRPRITDFGLAKHVGRTDQLETAEGAIVGTPAYMSPEQAEGKVDVAPATDIYALGVILYQMTTGQLPILGSNNISTLLAVKSQAPQPLRQLNADIPRDFESIVMKCLAKAADRRYSSAHALAEDLRRFVSNEPVVARATSMLERTGKWMSRNPVLTTAFAAITLALGLALVQWRSATAEFSRAEANFRLANAQNQRAEKQIQLSQKIIDEMVAQIAVDQELPPRLRRSVAEKAARYQEQLLEDSDNDPDAAAKAMRAYNRLTKLLVDLAAFKDALSAIEKSISLSDGCMDDENVAKLHTRATQMKASVLTLLDQNEEAIKIVSSTMKPANGPDKSSLKKSPPPASLFSIAMAKLDMKKFTEAIDAFDKSLEVLDESGSKMDVFQRGKTLLYRGRAEMELSQFEKALESTQEALACYKQIGHTHESYANVIEDSSRCYLQQSEILLSQIPDGAETNEKRAFTKRAIEPLRSARVAFEELIQKNDLVQRYWGQLAYCYFLQLKLELELEDTDEMVATLKTFDQWVATVPDKNVHRDDIREVLIQYRVKLAKLYRRLGDSTLAKAQVKMGASQVEAFLQQARKPQVFQPHQSTLKTLNRELEEVSSGGGAAGENAAVGGVGKGQDD